MVGSALNADRSGRRARVDSGSVGGVCGHARECACHRRQPRERLWLSPPSFSAAVAPITACFLLQNARRSLNLDDLCSVLVGRGPLEADCASQSFRVANCALKPRIYGRRDAGT